MTPVSLPVMSLPVTQRAGVAAFLALLVLVPFLLPSFLVFQLSIALTYAIAIIGLNLLMGFNGQISMAHGVFFAVGGYGSAILATRYGIPPLATIPLAALCSALLGLLVGIPALRLQGLQLAFLTLGLAVLLPPLLLKLEWLTKGATGISFAKPKAPAWLPFGEDAFLFILCMLGTGLTVVVALRLLNGHLGRALQAVRDNPLIAQSLGIDLTLVRLATFTISAACAGFGGALFAIINGYVSPESFSALKSFDFVAGAIIGGITSISGAFIGALFIVFVPEWSAGINLALAGVIYGVALVVMMLIARDGAVGLIKLGLAWLCVRLRQMGPSPVAAGTRRAKAGARARV